MNFTAFLYFTLLHFAVELHHLSEFEFDVHLCIFRNTAFQAKSEIVHCILTALRKPLSYSRKLMRCLIANLDMCCPRPTLHIAGIFHVPPLTVLSLSSFVGCLLMFVRCVFALLADHPNANPSRRQMAEDSIDRHGYGKNL